MAIPYNERHPENWFEFDVSVQDQDKYGKIIIKFRAPNYGYAKLKFEKIFGKDFVVENNCDIYEYTDGISNLFIKRHR